jgi:hypothetical protein
MKSAGQNPWYIPSCQRPFSHFIGTPHVRDIKFGFLVASGLPKLLRSFAEYRKMLEQANNDCATA